MAPLKSPSSSIVSAVLFWMRLQKAGAVSVLHTQHNYGRIVQPGIHRNGSTTTNTHPSHTTHLQSAHGEPVEKGSLERRQRSVALDAPGSGQTQCECCATQHKYGRIVQPGTASQQSNTQPSRTIHLQSTHSGPVKKSSLERRQRGVVFDVPGSGRAQFESVATEHNRLYALE